MDIKELMTFSSIVKEGTFIKSAEKLNYSQSAVTRQIQKLEKEFGVQLFEREWGATLTPQGEILAKNINNLISHLDYIKDEMISLGEEERGVINVGIHENYSNIIPRIFKEFIQLKPNMECNFISTSTEELYNKLIKNTIDFAFCGKIENNSITFNPILSEELCFIVSENHPLAGQKVTMEELFDFRFVTGGMNCLTYHLVRNQFNNSYKNNIIHATTAISVIPKMIENTEFIGAVFKSLPIGDKNKYLEVEINNQYVELGILSNKKLEYMPKTKKLFIEIIKNCIC
ncbi:LysR family transcriptional regulator [Paenibacillus brasilensis]|uniref:DNA-binding transcriptional LysR family regulator n=1 Tax=Paenibacillus brasilensis TaxID=128574 RepID=A0ABU0L499_9BACL|nr:LysR family transcriptional regulator [Paenibacillus brasilensis]MDQ0496105.1 DNA-binding transcriptional LysR family regulator [Paenibacillus brasilensis]